MDRNDKKEDVGREVRGWLLPAFILEKKFVPRFSSFVPGLQYRNLTKDSLSLDWGEEWSEGSKKTISNLIGILGEVVRDVPTVMSACRGDISFSVFYYLFASYWTDRLGDRGLKLYQSER